MIGIGVTVSAQEPETVVDGVVSDVYESQDSAETEGTVTDYIDRIKEAWTNGNLAEMLSLATALLILLATLLLKKGMKSLGGAVGAALANSKAAEKYMADKVNLSLGEMRESLDNLKKKIDVLVDKADGDRITANEVRKIQQLVTAEIKMLDNVYQHSKTIPAATKEQLAMTYTEAMRGGSKEVTSDGGKNEG